MALGWLLAALTAVGFVAAYVYDVRRRKWIAQLPKGTMYRPVNAIQLASPFIAALLMRWATDRIGPVALLPALVVAGPMIVVERRRRRVTRRRREPLGG